MDRNVHRPQRVYWSLCLHCNMWDTSRAALLSLQVRLPLHKSCFICRANRYLHTHIIIRGGYVYIFNTCISSHQCYLVRPLFSWPGSGGKNFTINLKNRSLVSDGERRTRTQVFIYLQRCRETRSFRRSASSLSKPYNLRLDSSPRADQIYFMLKIRVIKFTPSGITQRVYISVNELH